MVETAASSVRRRRRRRRSLRRRRLVALALVVVLAPVLYSYVTTMLKPSSVGIGVRSVEWVRANGGAGIVNTVERVYYKWTAPKKGGPTLKLLPTVGATGTRLSRMTYRPTRVSPLFTPALAGEGVWHATGPAVSGVPPVLVSVFRSSRDYPRVVAYVAWINHAVTQLALYPGRYEPPSGGSRGPMSVPTGQRWRLAATFNSGFTFRDAHGGFALNGRTYTPLVRGMGTLVGYLDGSVDVVAWHGGPTPGPEVAFARQNLPLIVSAGRKTSALNDSSAWGKTLGNAVLVWRSGVGIDRHGNVVYAAAPDQTVTTLASILIRAGAVRAIELDINTEWPSFITYAHWGARDPNEIVPNSLQSAARYLSPDDRDFFAVYRRVSTRLSGVPFR